MENTTFMKGHQRIMDDLQRALNSMEEDRRVEESEAQVAERLFKLVHPLTGEKPNHLKLMKTKGGEDYHWEASLIYPDNIYFWRSDTMKLALNGLERVILG